MNRIKKLFIIFFAISFASKVLAKDAPASFADLAEKLMPSVVNISTTQQLLQIQIHFLVFSFLQDHLLKICSKNLEHLKQGSLLH